MADAADAGNAAPTSETASRPASSSSSNAATGSTEMAVRVYLRGPLLSYLRAHPTLAITFSDAESERLVRAHDAGEVGVGAGSAWRHGADGPLLARLRGADLGRYHVDVRTGRLGRIDAPIAEMVDSSALLGRRTGAGAAESLYEAYERDGYLLLRGLVKGQPELERAVLALKRTVESAWGAELDTSTMRASKSFSIRGASDSGDASDSGGAAAGDAAAGGNTGAPPRKPAKLPRLERGKAWEKDVTVELGSNQMWSLGEATWHPGEEAKWEALVESRACDELLASAPIEHALEELCAGMTRRWLAPGSGGAYRHRDVKKLAWLRVRGTGMLVKEHADFHYVTGQDAIDGVPDAEDLARESRPKGADPVACAGVWVALGPWPVSGGALAVLPESHLFRGFVGRRNVVDEELPSAFQTQAKLGAGAVAGDAPRTDARPLPWRIAELAAGDVLVVDSQVVMASTVNREPRFYRASVDKRVVLRPELAAGGGSRRR